MKEKLVLIIKRYRSSNHFYSSSSCRLVSFFRLLNLSFCTRCFSPFSHCHILFIKCTNDIGFFSFFLSFSCICCASLLCWSVLFSFFLLSFSFEKYFVWMKQRNSYIHHNILHYLKDQINIISSKRESLNSNKRKFVFVLVTNFLFYL